MNKNTKIWLNYGLGAIISAILLWSIWLQVHDQLSESKFTFNPAHWQNEYFFIALAFMPLNLFLETKKWQLLAKSAQPLTMWEALQSVLGGIAISLVTPNRIGEYPGRILYLKRKNTIRLISVSILGAFAQFLVLLIAGLAGLIWYNMRHPGVYQMLILCMNVLILLFLFITFFSFEQWIARLEGWKWFRRFNTYSYLLRRFSGKQQILILTLSMLRFLVYTAQYLVLMRWMDIDMSLSDGFFTALLFFWAIAVIPSIALAELGIRGKVSLFLFQSITANSVGILTATFGLWCINLVLPALAGCILLIRMRLVK